MQGKLYLMGASIAALASSYVPVYAQSTPAARSAPSNDPSEIVVTATRREGTALEAPLSLTAIGEKELEKTGATSITQIADRIPGLTFATLGPNANRFFIRGIGSFASNQSPTTGLYFDETPLQVRTSTGLFSPDPIMYDLARVEVLRGPQGTLFGSSAMGGTIRFISNKPDPSKFEGKVYAEASTTDDGGDSYNLKGAVNIPLVEDKLAVRIVGVHAYDAGWIDNIRPVGANIYENVNRPEAWDRDVNWLKTNAVRVMVGFTPDATLRITPSFYYSRVKGGAVKPLQDEALGVRNRQEARWIDEPLDTRLINANLLVEKDVDVLGGMTLLSSTSYLDGKLDRIVDVTGFGPTQPGLVQPVGRRITIAFDSRARVKQWTQDLRVVSKSDGPLGYVAGAYYNNTKSPTLIVNRVINDYGTGAAPIQRIRDFGFKQEEKALYGELTLTLGAFELGAGGRYFRYDQTDSRLQARPFRTVPIDYDFSVRTKEDGFTPHLTAAFKPTPNQNFYVTYSQGFRTGGSNAPITEDQCPAALRQQLGIPDNPGPFKSDKTTNYEAGAKVRAGQVQFSGAVYQIDWDDYQQADSRSCGISAFSYTANAGKVRSRGAEAEVSVSPIEGLNLSGNAAYINAKFRNDNPSLGYKAGDALPDIPRWTYGGVAEATVPVNTALSFRLRGDFNHVSGMRTASGTSTGPTPDRRAAYTLVNASAALVSDDQWELTFFVRNLTDAIANYGYDTGYARSLSGSSDLSVLANRPRNIGVSFDKSF
ncbi:TonB-dependent receptor [Novosphingobium sp. AP12]|uniref:TonB-dependent receptor n=1 Tax=Novosphingobium sp. AP12 TaxID=1144305 RepID=UPI000271F1B2|nr:TonB-dependent receptor [Novosphingobium sp. AP12]EJL24225.1 outer membrane receptor protein [Novosphingobium sp. AP12]